MFRHATLVAGAMVTFALSAVTAADVSSSRSNSLGDSTWLLSYNWEPGSGTTAVTFYEDGTFKTSQGSEGRWVQRGADDARAFFAFSKGSLPDWSVVYSSTLSNDGINFSGIQGCADPEGQFEGTHTAVRTKFAEDPNRLQTVIAITSDVAADGAKLAIKTSSVTAAKKPAIKSAKTTAAKTTAVKKPAAKKTAAKRTPKATAKSEPKAATAKTSSKVAPKDSAKDSGEDSAKDTAAASKTMPAKGAASDPKKGTATEMAQNSNNSASEDAAKEIGSAMGQDVKKTASRTKPEPAVATAKLTVNAVSASRQANEK